MKHITVEALQKIVNPTIIDVRTKELFDIFHVPGATHVPELGATLNPEKFFDKETTYYFICNSGNASLRVATALEELGYICVNVLGGTKKYLEIME